MKTVTLVLTEAQHEFLRQMVENPQLSVPVKHARIAGEVYALITDARPNGLADEPAK